MRAALFGTYNRTHSANRIYATAARAAGYRVLEVHEPLWERTRDKAGAYFSASSLLRLGGQWLAAMVKLARAWRRSGGAEIAVVGFNGQLDVLLLRAITSRRYGPRIVFAPLVTLTETLVDDRGVYRPGSLLARLMELLDRLGFYAADVVVADTEAHRRYMIERLGADPSKVVCCHLGVDTSAFPLDTADVPSVGEPSAGNPSATSLSPAASSSPSPSSALPANGASSADIPDEGRGLEVLYVGQYLPLHGLDVVVDAVGRLAGREDVRFTFVGTGPERPRIEKLLRATRAQVEFVSWVEYEELGRRMAAADVALGIFGSSVKAGMVIPNKVFEAAAVGTAIVTADSEALREVFTPDRELLVCERNGESLAMAISRLADDAALRQRLTASAYDLLRTRFSDEAQGRAWRFVLGGLDVPVADADRDKAFGVVVVNFNDATATLACVQGLLDQGLPGLKVLVLDSGSDPGDADRLRYGLGALAGTEPGASSATVEFEELGENLGYSGSNNHGLRRLFEQGCAQVLVLNNDTIVGPGALAALAATADARPKAGPIGPRVVRDQLGGAPASLGERYWGLTMWLPRSLLRLRAVRQRPYEVGGVMGCAMLVSRALFEEVGTLREDFFAYYEEVEFCLRARSAGYVPLVQPAAEVAHRGHRGFAGGATPLAAYLKARNLWRLGTESGSPLRAVVFAPGFFALIGMSALGYVLRGRLEIVGALGAGVRAGLSDEVGPPPPRWFVVSGYPPPCETARSGPFGAGL